ncbi:efflux RND transporter periplasmic adaptor subunit [Paracoccus sp. (in: a-proteobacteria)]|uniref:efflux RND transporter periplasmic adaptor subunit n=1 Tax=Paracoccus sp. TaxID=267 RepID=UPI0032209AA2
MISSRGRPLRTALRLTLAVGLFASLAACKDDDAPKPEAQARPVRSITVTQTRAGNTVSLAGVIESQAQADLGFRIGGRMIERLASVGDQLEPGQVIARLDPSDEENGLRAAEANLTAAEGQLKEAETNFSRQRQLYDRGIAARAAFDRAETTLTNATAQADAARAQYLIAKRRLNDTELHADAPGRVTVVGAEPGEVVQPGRMIVQIARDGGLDAVFDVPAATLEASPIDPEVTVALSQNSAISTKGRIREVAPRADLVTGTFRVRVGLIDPPTELRLGSTVTGTALFGEGEVIEIPASALTSSNLGPAVWLVDPASNTVALHDIVVDSYLPASVVVADGLAPGDIVVTAGVQALRPGQAVRVVQ